MLSKKLIFQPDCFANFGLGLKHWNINLWGFKNLAPYGILKESLKSSYAN